MELFADFRDLLVELVDAGAEFVLVGGHAVAVHGHPRATKDLDVFVRPTAANAERVLRALTAFGAPLGQLGIGQADFSRPGSTIQLGVAPVRIDLLTSIDGIDFDAAQCDHASLSLEGRSIPVIGLAALLANKRASGRPQDLADIAALTSGGRS